MYLVYMRLQEQLLLSVLPVHLAVEMKNKMLKRLKDDASATSNRLDRKKSAYGRFHDMYVKVHENVRWEMCIYALPKCPYYSDRVTTVYHGKVGRRTMVYYMALPWYTVVVQSCRNGAMEPA